MEILVIGIDLAKSVFHLVRDGSAWEDTGQEAAVAFSDDGLYGEDSILPNRYESVLRDSLSWCGAGGSGTRHEVRTMSPRFVNPFLKSNKNDSLDAETIAEAVQRPNMRFPDQDGR